MRIAKAAAILLAIFAVPAGIALIFHYVPLHDFVEYWTAAHALVQKQNPYSVDLMMQLQQARGWTEDQPLVVMSPPQFLPFLVPLGFLHSYALARLIWFGLSAALLVFELFTLWSLYGGRSESRWVALTVAALFFPVWHCLAVAQIGPLLLLGVVGFLWLEERGHPFLAGSALALGTFKPHLFYLFWAALLLWSVARRELRVVLGAVTGVAIILGLALILDRSALSQYAALVRSDYVWEYTSGAGGVLRVLFGRNTRWLQFAPMLPGIVALAWYWRKYRLQWRWRDRLPVVLTLSVLTAAYGWPFDEVILLVPLVMIAVQCTYNAYDWRTGIAWLVGNFVVSLAAVLRYGDAAGMTVCAAGVLGYLIFDGLRAQRTREGDSDAEDDAVTEAA